MGSSIEWFLRNKVWFISVYRNKHLGFECYIPSLNCKYSTKALTKGRLPWYPVLLQREVGGEILCQLKAINSSCSAHSLSLSELRNSPWLESCPAPTSENQGSGQAQKPRTCYDCMQFNKIAGEHSFVKIFPENNRKFLKIIPIVFMLGWYKFKVTPLEFMELQGCKICIGDQRLQFIHFVAYLPSLLHVSD